MTIGGAEDANERLHDKDCENYARNVAKDGSIHGQGRCDFLRSDKEISRRGRLTQAEEGVCRYEGAGRPLRKKEY